MRSLLLRGPAALLLACDAGAQCLDWSRAFPPPGVEGRVDALVADAGGALILGGSFFGADAVVSPNAVRWTGVGYQPLGGIALGVTDLWRVDLGAGASVYAGSYDTGPNSLYRLEGTAWVPIGAPRPVKDLVAFDSGHGVELHAISGSAFGVADFVQRLAPGGWVPLAGGLQRDPEALAVFDDGSGPALYAAGDFEWQAFGSGPAVRGIGRWSNGIWVEVGGGLARTNGSPALPFELVVHDFGAGPRLVVAGIFDAAGGQPIRNLAAWDGSTWSAVMPALDGAVLEMESVLLPAGRKLALSGTFTTAGGAPARPPILVDGSGWTELGPSFAGLDVPGIQTVRAFEAHDDGQGLALFVGGAFEFAGSEPASGIARFDGATWHALTSPDGVEGDVWALELHDDGSGPALHAAGRTVAFGGSVHGGVGRFDGTAWSVVGPPSTPSVERVSELCSADLSDGRRLYAGGNFTSLGGAPAIAIARWDGAAWSALPGGDLGGSTPPTVTALLAFDDGSGRALHVGGVFQSAGGVPSTNVARWTPSGGWSALGAGLPSSSHVVSAFAVFDAGGGPELFAGTVSHGIYRFDGATWNALPLPPANPGVVHALASDPFGAEPLLFVGGQFQSIGGIGALNLAAWDGSAWRTFGDGASGIPSAEVTSFHLFDDGQGDGPKLAAAGSFTQIGGVIASNVALWDGVAWQPAGGGVNGTVDALASFDDDEGPSLFLAGGFTSTSAAVASGFARWGRDGDPGCAPHTGETSCDGSGAGAACPCGNSGAPLFGCGNSVQASGARLRARGAANVSDDTVRLEIAGTPPSAAILFFQGTTLQAGGAGVVFGDGVRCLGGAQVRLGVRTASAGTASFGAGNPLDPSVSSAGGVTTSATRHVQAWYRDPNPSFCTSATFNLSNAVTLRWADG